MFSTISLDKDKGETRERKEMRVTGWKCRQHTEVLEDIKEKTKERLWGRGLLFSMSVDFHTLQFSSALFLIRQSANFLLALVAFGIGNCNL